MWVAGSVEIAGFLLNGTNDKLAEQQYPGASQQARGVGDQDRRGGCAYSAGGVAGVPRASGVYADIGISGSGIYSQSACDRPEA